VVGGRAIAGANGDESKLKGTAMLVLAAAAWALPLDRGILVRRETQRPDCPAYSHAVVK
jgi:hypothetical protein